MKATASALLLFLVASVINAEPVTAGGSPTTTNNDDSCDIALFPAATLLLPSFEVDFRSPASTALNTILTITNVTSQPQIANMTIWTDRAFPVLNFNIFLTGYDVQGINLYDIIARGQIPPTGSSSTNSPRGSRSGANSSNPNLVLTNCASLPGPIPASLLADVQNALTTGNYGTLTGVGNVHSNAIGSLTVDVVGSCSVALPTDSFYYTGVLLFDNVLIGDTARIDPSVNYSSTSPMVHIRAIPEGGPAGAAAIPTNLPYTFYDRYTPAATPKFDRRQPLPGTFAARYIEAPSSGFATTYSIWREGVTSGNGTNVSANSSIPVTEIVRFDEHENATISVAGDSNGDGAITVGDVFYLINNLFASGPAPLAPGDANGDGTVSVGDVFYLINNLFAAGPPAGGCATGPCRAPAPLTPAVSRPRVSDASIFPPRFTATGDVGGWIYLNLNNGGSFYSSRATGTPLAGVSQSWVTVHQEGEGRYGFDSDALMMGNGCSRSPGITSPALPIAPAANTTP